MLIVILAILLLAIGIFIKKRSSYLSNWEMLGEILMVGNGLLLIVTLVTIPLINLRIKAEIQEFYSIQITLESARKNAVGLEKAAIQNEIIKANRWLAINKYYNETIFKLWIPDEVMELEPIK